MVDRYGISVSQMTKDMLHLSTGITSGAETAYPSGAPEFNSSF
jgi:hypothetical protein